MKKVILFLLSIVFFSLNGYCQFGLPKKISISDTVSVHRNVSVNIVDKLNDSGEYLKKSGNADIAAFVLTSVGSSVITLGIVTKNNDDFMERINDNEGFGKGLIITGSIITVGGIVSKLFSIAYKKKSGKMLLNITPTSMKMRF